jgi:signal transduction histidine kinase
MWLDVLALAPQADKLAQAVDAIKRNLARQTRLVNDLSDASKIQSSALDVQLGPVDLVALVKSHLDAWQLAAISKQLAFAHRIEPATALVKGDGARLLQALSHVVDNAIASTPTGGRVALGVQLHAAACVVTVEDSGVGLSTDDVTHLGTPLWRAPATSKSRPGLGLGLAIAHHLTARHGGTLEATSGSNGALFTLTLPLAARQDES